MNEELKKRLLSFAWRLGAYMVVAGIGFIVKNLTNLGVSAEITAVVALIAGEFTKWLNSKYELGSKVLGVFKK
jgi:hypothetical protein